MTAALKQQLGNIVAQEEAPEVDWATVSRLCAALAAELGPAAPLPVQEYLAAVGRRRWDGVFAQAQRSDLVRYLRGL